MINATYSHAFSLLGVVTWGFVFPTVQQGDEVFVLYGGRMPFILRPRNEGSDAAGARYYRIIGDCYLHNFMDGEAVNNHDYQEKKLILR